MQGGEQGVRLRLYHADGSCDRCWIPGELDRYPDVFAQLAGLGRRPDEAETQYSLGVAYAERGRHEEAMAAYREAIRLAPDCARAHCDLGVSSFARRRHEESVACYEEALRLSPTLAAARFNLAAAYGRLGRKEEEVAGYREALRLKRDYAQAHYNLGVACYWLDRRKEAVAAFRKASRLQPAYAKAHYNLGVTYLLMDRDAMAMAAFESAVRSDPEYAVAHFNLGTACARLGWAGEAVAAYQEAGRLRPELFGRRQPVDAEDYLSHRVAAMAVERREEAVASYEETIRLKTDHAEARDDLATTCPELSRQVEDHYRRGEVYRRKKRHEEAVAEFEDVVRLQPDHVPAHLALSTCHSALGNSAAAQHHWRMALELNPGETFTIDHRPRLWGQHRRQV